MCCSVTRGSSVSTPAGTCFVRTELCGFAAEEWDCPQQSVYHVHQNVHHVLQWPATILKTKQHTSEKGLCSDFEFDFLVLNRPYVPAPKAHCNVLHYALLTLCCSLQDLVTTIKTLVLCLVVLRLAVLFLEEVWKTMQRNPQCRENTPHATPCAMVWKSLPCLFQCQHHMVCVCDVRCSVGSVCSGKTWKKSQTTDYPQTTILRGVLWCKS